MLTCTIEGCLCVKLAGAPQVPHSDHARGKGPRGPNRAGRGRGRGGPPQKRARPLGSIPSLDRHMARRKVGPVILMVVEKPGGASLRAERQLLCTTRKGSP